jgi:hypothetical protein
MNRQFPLSGAAIKPSKPTSLVAPSIPKQLRQKRDSKSTLGESFKIRETYSNNKTIAETLFCVFYRFTAIRCETDG